MHLYVQFSILAIVTIFILWYFNSLLKWIRPTFEDKGNTASYKRITAFLFTASALFMVFTDKITSDFTLSAFISLLIASAVYAMIITVENLITIVKLLKGGSMTEDKEVIKTGDTITIEKE